MEFQGFSFFPPSPNSIFSGTGSQNLRNRILPVPPLPSPASTSPRFSKSSALALGPKSRASLFDLGFFHRKTPVKLRAHFGLKVILRSFCFFLPQKEQTWKNAHGARVLPISEQEIQGDHLLAPEKGGQNGKMPKGQIRSIRFFCK